MRQSWRNLAFLHRRADPGDVQSVLPEGLCVDTFEGAAFVGLVPFTMQDVRLNGLPPLPAHRRFLETNIRTYVRDRNGRAGVWFFSLDCDDWLSVRVARTWFGLNYRDAYLSVGGDSSHTIYSGGRLGVPEAEYWIRCHVLGKPEPAKVGSLEFWLVERYLLFANRRGQLISGRVFHQPYSIQKLQVDEFRDGLVPKTTGLDCAGEWDHAAFSPGVDVEVFAPHRLPTTPL